MSGWTATGEPASGGDERLVVVGAGLAGLTAAYRAAGLAPLVLERAPHVAGRTRSLDVGDGRWVDLGAHWLPRPAIDLADELGVAVYDYGRHLPAPSLWFKGRRVIARNRLQRALQLPLGLRARRDLARLARRTRAALRERAAGGARELDDVPLLEWLGDIHPDIARLLGSWSTQSGAKDVGELSALAGLPILEMGVLGDIEYEGTVVGGTGRLCEALAGRLGDGRVLTSATVTRIRAVEAGDRVEVRYEHEGAERVVRAEQCVVSLLPHDALAVCEGLPADKAAALEALVPARLIATGVVVEGGRTAPWRDIYWMRVESAHVTNIMHPAWLGPGRRPAPEPAALSVLSGGKTAERLWDLPEEEARERVLGELFAVFPEARGRTRVVAVQRWDPAFYTYPPGAAAVAQLRGSSVGRIHFCGDYLYGVGTDHAIRGGEEAAARVAAAG